MFAVAYTILWRPLPYPEADRLAALTLNHRGDPAGGVGAEQFVEWTDRIRTADVAGYEVRDRSVRGDAGLARITPTAFVSERFFEVLALPATAGTAPNLARGDPCAVVSARMAAQLAETEDASAIGQVISLGDLRLEIVGIMPTS